MAELLGPDGRPIAIKALGREHATPTISGVRRVADERVSAKLTPEKLGRILREAQEGNARDYLTLAEEMEERYHHYASQLQTRRLAMDAIDISIEAPKGCPAKIVDAVSELAQSPELREALGDLSDGIAKGYSVVEMMWEYQRGTLRPVRYVWRDPRFFVFDRLSLQELRLAVDGSLEGEELPQAKYLRHMPRTKLGIPLRRGLARLAAWAWIIQAFGLQDWAAFSEIYGIPFRVGKYGAGASAEDKRTLLRAVASIGSDAAAIIPESMMIEFIETNGSRGEAVFGGLLGYVDKQISKVVVGQTMTADDGASLGQAKIHNEVRLDILRADCRQTMGTVNRDLIRPFVDLNFGPQAVYPRVEMPVADPEDVDALSNAIARLVPVGLKVKAAEIREKLGLSEPLDDDEVLAPAAPVAPAQPGTTEPPPVKPPADPKKPARLAAHVDGCRCGGCLRVGLLAAEPAGEPDGVAEADALVDEMLADWEVIAEPLLGPIAREIEASASYEELRARLAAAIGAMDPTELVERLARATAIARGIGDIRD